MALIDTADALAGAMRAVARLDPALDRLVASGAAPTLRRGSPDFAGLCAIVVGQQVSTVAAAAILARLELALPGLSPEAVAGASDETLLGAGLSRAKLRTFRFAAAAALDGSFRPGELAPLPPEEARAHLRTIPGVGPWTAEVFLLFGLGHPDVFPAGDLALQEAARDALALPARPSAEALAEIATRWSPWRGAAAYLLWAHYRQLRSRDGAPARPAT